MSSRCPSCYAVSGFGPDEDGYDVCLDCHGPYYCTDCSEPVEADRGGVTSGFNCEVCGELYHDRCFPRLGSDLIICQKCHDDAGHTSV